MVSDELYIVNINLSTAEKDFLENFFLLPTCRRGTGVFDVEPGPLNCRSTDTQIVIRQIRSGDRPAFHVTIYKQDIQLFAHMACMRFADVIFIIPAGISCAVIETAGTMKSAISISFISIHHAKHFLRVQNIAGF